MRLKKNASALITGLILMSSVFCVNAYAHGVGYRQSALRSIPMDFFYSTGDTMACNEFEVWSPADDKFPWQEGRTDQEGHIAFMPDCVGKWKVIVDSGDGHRAVAEIDIGEDFLNNAPADQGKVTVKPSEAAPHGINLLMRCLCGVSILFNISAAVLLYKGKKGV